MHAPTVKVEPRTITPAARWSRDYRARRATVTNTGKRKIKTPVGIFPLPLESTLRDILIADPGFKPPPPGASEYQFRQAVAALAARILKKSLIKK
ncbi:MAG: hypothetical protein ACXVOI_09520 [Tumebacillaceae bacterium]